MPPRPLGITNRPLTRRDIRTFLPAPLAHSLARTRVSGATEPHTATSSRKERGAEPESARGSATSSARASECAFPSLTRTSTRFPLSILRGSIVSNVSRLVFIMIPRR